MKLLYLYWYITLRLEKQNINLFKVLFFIGPILAISAIILAVIHMITGW